MDDAGLITSPNLLNLSHLSKRAVVSLSMIVVALISAFLAGSAVGFAVQGQVAKQHAKQLEQEIDKVEARVNILKGNIEMATFLNSISSLASHNMATTVILAHSVARMANYYAGGATTISGAKEKQLVEAIQAIKDYIGKNKSEPVYKDGDKEDYRQLCTTQVTAS